MPHEELSFVLPEGNAGRGSRRIAAPKPLEDTAIENEVFALKLQLTEAREECRQLQKKTDKLEIELKSMVGKHDEVMQQCLKAKEESRQWRMKEANARSELAKKNSELEKAAKQATQFRGALKDGKGEVVQLVEEVRRMGEQVQSLQEESEASKEWGRQLERELEVVKERERKLMAVVVESERGRETPGDEEAKTARSKLFSAVSTMEQRVVDAEREASVARQQKEEAMRHAEERVKTAVSKAETESDLRVAYLESEVKSLNDALRHVEHRLKPQEGEEEPSATRSGKTLQSLGLRRERVLSPTAGYKEREQDGGASSRSEGEGARDSLRFFRGRRLARGESTRWQSQRSLVGSGGSSKSGGSAEGRGGERKLQRSESSINLRKIRADVSHLRSHSSSALIHSTPRAPVDHREASYDLDLPSLNSPPGVGESSRVDRC